MRCKIYSPFGKYAERAKYEAQQMLRSRDMRAVCNLDTAEVQNSTFFQILVVLLSRIRTHRIL